MSRTVLHLLAQRPGRTGSGVTLDALVREAGRAGWDQHAAVGVPAAERPAAGDLPPERVRALRFGAPPLEFDVPGMSDVMPYPSTRFADLDDERWGRYRAAWRELLERLAAEVRPAVVHAHHVWLLAALARDAFPAARLVVHVHATGLRQMELCPARAPEVAAGVARADAFVALHAEHATRLAERLGIPRERVHVVGAGFRAELFHGEGRAPEPDTVLYAGKLAEAKGVAALCTAVERLARRRPRLRLHVAGAGAGAEAEQLRARLERLGATLHGALDQPALGELLRRTSVCVLPSYYEGLPLVLVEAAACGCRLVASALPGVERELAPRLGAALETVALPRLEGVDRPVEADVPAFAERLAAALERALAAGPLPAPPDLAEFGWPAVFRRIEAVWTAR